ncbi:MAG: TIGR03435 family protein [Terriglobales bacterium]
MPVGARRDRAQWCRRPYASWGILLFVTCACPVIRVQAGPPAPAATASVRWVCAQAGRGGGCPTSVTGPPRIDPTHFICGFCTASYILARAYGVSVQQLQGGPAWIDRDRYQLVIATDAPATPAEMMRLLQRVLDRSFSLRARVVAQPVDGYALVVSPHGVKFRSGPAHATSFSGATLRFSTIPQLVAYLNSLYYGGRAFGVSRPIADSTGLRGNFDIRLRLPEGPGESVLAGVRQQLGLDFRPAPGLSKSVKVVRISQLRTNWTGSFE